MPTRKTAALTGRCLICGTDLCAPVFDCPACATPHHSGCWQWTGGCAVYGCSRVPRPAPHREEEVAHVMAAAERLRHAAAPPPLRPRTRRPLPPEPVPPTGTGPLVSTILHLCLVFLFAVMGASLDASQKKARADRPASHVAARVAVRWPSTSVSSRSRHELQAEQLLRNDGLWGGNGTEPIAGLRRLMVAQEGEAVRSGMRQLARRDLPGWVRARLDALELDQLAALRRP